MKYVALIAKTGTGYSGAPARPARLHRRRRAALRKPGTSFREAAAFHLEGMVEDGEQVPEPIYAAVEVEVEVPAPAAS